MGLAFALAAFAAPFAASSAVMLLLSLSWSWVLVVLSEASFLFPTVLVLRSFLLVRFPIVGHVLG